VNRIVLREAAALLAAAAVPAFMSAAFHLDFAQRGDVRPGEVPLSTVTEWNDEVLWVDARQRAQFETSHIPGAVLLNEDEWGNLLTPFLNQWQPEKRVVVYCDSASCRASHEVAERLRTELGLTNVFVLKGGWDEWQRAR
jgi:rhodanese-related sulfurtransferase